MTRRHVSDFIKDWRKHSHQCIVCGKWTTDPGHHRLPKSQGGEDSWGNVVPMCLQCHGVFHGIWGVTSMMAGKVKNRIENATKWLGKFPPADYPNAWKALPPQVLEEMVFDGVPGWEGYQEGLTDE